MNLVKLLLTGTTLLAHLVLTQTASASEEALEIVATAYRGAALIQGVPISITPLSGNTLTSDGIRSTEQLSGLTPGLLVQRSVVGKVSIRTGHGHFDVQLTTGIAG